MRFASTKRLVFLLVAVLLTASLVSSLSIPNKRDGAVDLVDGKLAKRAAKAATSSRAAATTSRAVERSSTARPASTSRPASAAASSSASAAAASSSAPSSSAPASSSAAASNATGSSNITSSATMSTEPSNATTSPTSNETSVPTGGMSTGAVAGIGVVCGVAVLGAGIFAMMRYKRKASLTQNLGNKSVNQFSSPSSYPAASPFPAGNTGYERLSDPSLSGASVPSGVPQQAGQQQGLGTFNVISTYTPTLGDELEIQPGDKVTILVEYDDGWCQGVNESRGRVKGVFPKHCVDYGSQGGMEDAGRGKRVSSMYGSGGYRM